MSAPNAAKNPAPSGAASRLRATRRIALACLTLGLCYLILLGGALFQGDFLIDRQGRPIANDFVDVVAAGRLALDGDPAAAYDWPIHKEAEIRAVGHDFDNYYGWHYPPTFLFVAAALATVPYLAAAIGWLVATFTAYTAALGGILGRRTGLAVAVGFPAVLWNFTAGQNGCLTAALIGGTLGLLERRPALAGVCLGLLTYKPQFGLLFPLALIADRRWTALAVAAVTGVTLAALSWLVFGTASWQAFVHWMPITSHAVLGEGRADFSRLQSVVGLVRAHGGGERLAWTAQIAASLAVGLGVTWLWYSRTPFDLKAAALAAGALVVSPYLYMYDLVVLGVSIAFLLRFALASGLVPGELVGVGGASVLILIYPYVKTQVGFAAALIVLFLIAHRAGHCVARRQADVALQ